MIAVSPFEGSAELFSEGETLVVLNITLTQPNLVDVESNLITVLPELSKYLQKPNR